MLVSLLQRERTRDKDLRNYSTYLNNKNQGNFQKWPKFYFFLRNCFKCRNKITNKNRHFTFSLQIPKVILYKYLIPYSIYSAKTHFSKGKSESCLALKVFAIVGLPEVIFFSSLKNFLKDFSSKTIFYEFLRITNNDSRDLMNVAIIVGLTVVIFRIFEVSLKR